MTISSLQHETEVAGGASVRPLRILMILHMPWTRELGAPRVSLEIAEELEKRGHHVDKYDIDDAFPRPSKLVDFFRMALFPGRAAHYVRTHGHKFDVIQAEQGNLPYTKSQLGYSGVLIARSNGLAHFYEDYEKSMKKTLRARGEHRGSLVGNTLRAVGKAMDGGLKNVETSFDSADAIVLINQDEMDYVAQKLGHQHKSHLLPNALSESRFAEFAEWQVDPEQRHAEHRVVLVGQWSERKGSGDLPKIVRLVRRDAPETRFLFLGARASSQTVRDCFAEVDRPSIEVVESYASSDLPKLLSGASLGIFPSYIEGFPFGVLEQLAAGLPTIAYDVPGPREMLKHFGQSMLVPTGNAEDAASRLVELLNLSQPVYAELSQEALAIANRFHWETTANQMLDIYAQKLEDCRR